MRVVIVGCGRTGSSVAKELAAAGWDVTVVDDDEAALSRLGEWRGGFVVGHAMDLETLERAGVAGAEAVVVCTDGDNTNLVVAQVVQRRYDVGCVVVRILDPHRAALYAEWGLQTVCPTQTAIATVTDLVRAREGSPVGSGG
jgi:trk system potassium uptake protein TrkA